ncbi:hypothetical protein THUN1379_20960 [Paludibacterium sp. THUN1379]|nr:hypothetical protein THUN1379_20960 [Paludibacterium sp. THUN1379]
MNCAALYAQNPSSLSPGWSSQRPQQASLGTRLLIRTTRKLTLTDAGVAYVAAGRRILEQVEEAEREAAGEFTTPKGELVMTAPLMFGRLHVLPLVAEFLAANPQISIRLLLSDRNVDLVSDHVDLALRIGKLPDSTMGATQIGEMRVPAPRCWRRTGDRKPRTICEPSPASRWMRPCPPSPGVSVTRAPERPSMSRSSRA